MPNNSNASKVMLFSIKYKLSSGVLVNQIRLYLSTTILLTCVTFNEPKKEFAWCIFIGMVLII